MNLAGRIRRNSLFALLAQSVRVASNTLLFVGLARIYGPEAFGQFTAAHTLATIMLLIADFGFDALLATELARRRSQAAQVVLTYFTMKCVFAVVAVVLMNAVAAVQDVSGETRFLMHVFSGYVFLSALINFSFAMFKGLEELQWEAGLSLLMNVLVLLLLPAAQHGAIPIGVIGILFVATRVPGLLLAVVLARRRLPFAGVAPTFPGREERAWIAVFGFQAILATLFFVQDTILLSWWAGDRQVGMYQAVIKIVGLALLAADIPSTTLLPVLARLGVEDPPRRRALARLLHKSLVSMGAVFGFVCVVFAEPVVGFVYGLDSYGEAVPVLRVFGIIVLVRHACEASGLLLTTSRRQHVRLGVVACAVVLNAGLNAFAIPAYGIAGAAAVALVTNVLVSAGYIVAAWRENSGWFFEARTYAPLIVAGLLGCGLWFGGMTRHLALLPPAVLLLGAAVLYLGFSPADRHVVFSRGGIGRAADRVTRGPAH